MNRLQKFMKNLHIPRIRYLTTRFTADGKEVPKAKNFANRITLVGVDNSVSITDLKHAQNLSIKRELKLVKIQDADSKSRRPVYRLMTNAEYHSEELEKRKTKQASRQNNSLIKGDKLITLSSRIGENDLMTSVKKILKLLEKQYEVKIVITGSSGEEIQRTEHMSAIIEKNVITKGKLTPKISKGNSIKYQIIPIIENRSSTNADSNHTNPDHNDNDKGPL